MAERAALVTGGSSGIGLAIARLLGEEGYAVTIVARRPEKLEQAAEELRAAGIEAHAVAAQLAEEEKIVRAFAEHRERWGRLDVLVNNAGFGFGAALDSIPTKHLDLQMAVNLRATVIATREGIPMLREAGAEHRKALIVNMASIAGKAGQPWLSVYGATKAAIVNFTQATQREVSGQGIQATAICPGFVDTAMTDFIKEQISADEMMRPEDVAEAVRFLLRTSPNCLVPEIVLARPAETGGQLL